MKLQSHKGFTLVEILLVITLISILMGIVVFAINPRNIISEANDNRIEADAMTIYQALEQYALKNNAYPTAIVNMPNNSSAYICKTNATNCTNSNQISLSSLLIPIYLSKIPEYSTDTNNSGFYVVKDINGRIGIGGVKQVNNTTFVKGLESQSFATNPNNYIPPGVVFANLMLYLDAGSSDSYNPNNSSVVWRDISYSTYPITRDATLYGSPTWAGYTQAFFNIDNESKYISLANTGLIHRTNDFTYSCWINFNSFDSFDTIFENGFWPDSLILRYENNGFKILAESSERGFLNWTGTTGVWYNIVIKRENGVLSVFVNNTSIGTSFNMNTDIDLANTNLWLMRSQHTTGQSTNGKIGIFSAYNRALTNTEIQQNFNTHRARYGL